MSLALCVVLLLTAPFSAPGGQGTDPDPTARVAADPAAGAIQLVDATAGSGLSMVTTSGRGPSTHILEVKGGGIALIDVDGDGDEDLFFPNGATLLAPDAGPGARLFENLGGLRFADITDRMGVAHRRWSFGVARGDVNADGHEDLFIACLGPDTLLLGEGGGQFRDASAQWLPPDEDWNTGAAFADVDGDGDLDLYVCGYVEADPVRPLPPAQFKGIEVLSGPRGYPAQPDRLLLNDGSRFLDVSAERGIRTVPDRYALNVVAADFTGDGHVDLFVGNDSQPDTLWVNDGKGSFIDRGTPSGVAINLDGSGQATMGIAVGDVDGNGRPDIVTTNFSSDTNTLHLNLDGQFFDDRTSQFGVGAPSRTWCGWGAAFADLDHDGDEDLLGVNGHVYPQATKTLMDSDYRQPVMLMRREGSRFITQEAGLGSHVDRSMVMADLDGDGDLDAVVLELNGPVRVIRNESAGAKQPDGSVLVRLSDATAPGNRSGIGSVVALLDADGKAIARRWMVGGGPFQSTASRDIHFGVPVDARGSPLTVLVRWPDGTQTRTPLTSGSRVVVEHAAMP
ncbi:MAG: CRTAC1 family protein [Planctomycetota bacterium]|nr:CRTAC1 family protein [Planctomycetota bacterium]MDA1105761.1 CRTAC1 family protein [Planctomycetota bacterium]